VKVVRLNISNFRGVKSAELHFGSHNLLVGTNNIGKSTICEALDLVLGPDRLSKYPSIEEYDFHNAIYTHENGDLVKIRIEIVLTDLSEENQSMVNHHIEFWDQNGIKVLSEGEIGQVDTKATVPCLRLEFHGVYDPDEDEFVAKTYFSHSPDEDEGELKEVPKSVKRKIGFLYLRALRTGSRALSLERGSLLDLILRLGEVRPKLWEDVRKTLLKLDLDEATSVLRPVLNKIENKLAEYIPIHANGHSTKLFVSQLTREHLRKTLSFFLTVNPGQEPVPFYEVGTGTLNALVLSLLSFIAELKKDNVIFAMEEPEIALPPHTQRRIIKYLLENTTQSFVTSHSPYVIERFDPEQILLLKREPDSGLSGQSIAVKSTLKPKNYKRQIRRSIAEALLGKAVIIVEGLTESELLEKSAEMLESFSSNNYPLDLSGVTIFDAGGDGNLSEYGSFFKSCGLTTFAFYDKKIRKDEEKTALQQNYSINFETPYEGSEKLLAQEISIELQWKFLTALKKENKITEIPEAQPKDAEIQKFTTQICKDKKGDGRAVQLLSYCDENNIPATIKTFLSQIYEAFPKPKPLHVIEAAPMNAEDSN
jgi:putative ATP-dependent endonuclease of the OLD family